MPELFERDLSKTSQKENAVPKPETSLIGSPESGKSESLESYKESLSTASYDAASKNNIPLYLKIGEMIRAFETEKNAVSEFEKRSLMYDEQAETIKSSIEEGLLLLPDNNEMRISLMNRGAAMQNIISLAKQLFMSGMDSQKAGHMAVHYHADAMVSEETNDLYVSKKSGNLSPFAEKRDIN